MKDETIKRVSVDIPIDLLKEIDKVCKTNFITRRKWFIDASMEKLEKETDKKLDKIVRG
jgi:metal-responsive CopG/Arc/MetJ family transcriptional regulator